MPRLATCQSLLYLPLLAALLLLGGCSDGPALPPLGPGDTILAFGDSLTYGTGAGEGESYPERLAELIGMTVVRSGVPGETTPRGRERLPEVLDEVRPALVILCEGGNDILRKVPREQTIANLRAMIATIREAGATPVLMSVPDPGLFLGPAEFYAEIAESEGVLLVDGVISDILSDRSLKSDTIHPNAAGYRLIAEAIARHLRESGALL